MSKLGPFCWSSIGGLERQMCRSLNLEIVVRNLNIDQESDRAIRYETLAKTDLVEVRLRGDKG